MRVFAEIRELPVVLQRLMLNVIDQLQSGVNHGKSESLEKRFTSQPSV